MPGKQPERPVKSESLGLLAKPDEPEVLSEILKELRAIRHAIEHPKSTALDELHSANTIAAPRGETF